MSIDKLSFQRHVLLLGIILSTPHPGFEL